MKYTGYHFFIDDLELPYAPSELKITIGSNNKTVELINGNEINILKNPKLTEIEFDIELPRGRQYAFANTLESPIKYTDYFEKLMTTKKPTKLVITRQPPNGGVGNTLNGFASNTWTATLEGYKLKESAENAFDIIVSLKFKEYIPYGTVKATVVNTTSNNSSSTAVQTENKTVVQNKTHTVVKGDTLCKISRKYYGTSSNWKTIYNANQAVIENAAKKHGKASSQTGHWIYPGTVLVIPMSGASSSSTSSSSSSSSSKKSNKTSNTQSNKKTESVFYNVEVNCVNPTTVKWGYFILTYWDENNKRVEEKVYPTRESPNFKRAILSGTHVILQIYPYFTQDVKIVSSTSNWAGLTEQSKYIKPLEKNSTINFKWV